MLNKKVCMLGSYGVGKTSLVSRFVHSKFSDQYQSTIGVKVDRKSMTVDETVVNLLLWDLHGDDEFQRVRATYLRGMSAYLLVIDGTRPASIDVAVDLHQLPQDTVGTVPFLALINKSDLLDDWQVADEQLQELRQRGWNVHQTSAKTGEHVEESFQRLGSEILSRHNE